MISTRNRGASSSTHNAPTIRIRDDIFYEETLQRSQVSLLRGSDKGLEKPSLLLRTDRRATPLRNVFASTRDQLACIRFFHLYDVRNLSVGVIERFAQNIGRTLCRRKLLKEQQNC